MSEEDPNLRKDPLNSVFPKVAKCTFNKFGPSGTIEKFDGLCVVSLNIINEKVIVLFSFIIFNLFLRFTFCSGSGLSSCPLSLPSNLSGEHCPYHQEGQESSFLGGKLMSMLRLKQIPNPNQINICKIYLFSKSMLPSAVPSSVWETGFSSSRWERMQMSTSLQIS